MGIIRDAISSALGANQLNNGLPGKSRLPFTNDNNRSGRGSSSSTRNQSSSYYQRYENDTNRKQSHRRLSDGNNFSSQSPDQYDNQDEAEQDLNNNHRSSMDRYSHDGIQRIRNGYGGQTSQPPPGYETYIGDGRGYQMQSYNGQTYAGEYYTGDRGSRGAIFRPLALPQTAYGDGQPFLRGYSRELSRYNITMEDFMQVLDSINIAIIPSPENQIFQKGANIAGWFLPGAAGIGLMIGQIGVGLGAAGVHASQLSSTLLNANMNLFLPNGLELGIGSSTDVDAEVGISQGSARLYSINISPRERLACYGDLIAPISHVLPPLRHSGRNDPIALLGRGMSSRESQKKMEKAQKKLEKGKSKDIDRLEGGLKWLIVRRASASALAYWETRHQR